MSVHSTVVFTDLIGSTGVFEALGNAKATQVVREITQWIASVCESNGGRVVKTMGDGVLALFPSNSCAIDAVVEMQRKQQQRILQLP
ncbi:MAG: adenylate/guanylate cyclase domain-containing protein, partial [Rhodoferax sp.]|nr:adenylate/guanylate cyclase domain-containing protein [Rhodoferax sp.]